MNAAICAIGDELLIGQVINSNAAWIAAECTSIGMTIVSQSVVGDEPTVLKAELDRLRSMADVILLTGGLGPTHDDITKDVLVDYFSDVLIEHEPTLEQLHLMMQRRGRELTPRNATQALVPATCTVLTNPIGTAPGMLFERDGIVVVSMPGVPDEMKSMMKDHVLPFLAERQNASGDAMTSYRTLLTTGIPEAYLADRLGEPSSFLNGASLAYLPNYHGVRLRIGVRSTSADERRNELDRIAAYIYDRAGANIYGEGDTTLAKIVGLLLQERRENVSVAESCTGGLLGAAFTDIPGSSVWFEGGVISYANDVKVRELDVKQSDLDTVGAVSEEVARQMCEGIRSSFGTTYGIGITGVAGPDGGSEDKPVGTVWIGVAGPAETIVRRFGFGENRRMNRERSVATALAMLLGMLRENRPQ